MADKEYDDYGLSDMKFPQSRFLVFLQKKEKLLVGVVFVAVILLIPLHSARAGELIGPKLVKYVKGESKGRSWKEYFSQKVNKLGSTMGENLLTSVFLTTTVISALWLKFTHFDYLTKAVPEIVETAVEKLCRIGNQNDPDFFGLRIHNFTLFDSNLFSTDLEKFYNPLEEKQMLFCTYKGFETTRKISVLLVKPVISKTEFFIKVLSDCGNSKDEFFACIATLGTLSDKLGSD
jgi:hypothetical protein